MLTLVLAPVLASAQAVVVDPGQTVTPGIGPDVTPGYYPTWQSSQPSATGGSAPGLLYGGRYTRTGWPTGQTTMQYRDDLQPGTAPMISPYLLRNDLTPGGQPTNGHTADLYLSPFVPGTAVFYSNGDRTNTRISWDAGLSLHQDVDVQYAQIQAGPLFINFTQIEADLLYSDISGPYAQSLPSDGFIAAVGLYFNIDLRISPRTFFTLAGALFYVPTSYRVGFYLTGGNAAFAQFEHSFEVGTWDVTIFDYVDAISPMNYLLQNLNSSAFDRSGLYTLGFITQNFDERPFSRVYYRNTVGIRGSTFLGPDLRFSTGYEHYDTWQGNGDHLVHEFNLDHYYAGLFYEPKDLWLMPWVTYDAYEYDNYSGSLQQVFAGATMPISPEIQAYARVGYAWLSGHNGRGIDDGSLVWDVGISQKLSLAWSHSLAVGDSYRISPLLQTTSGLYGTYTINYAPPESRFSAAASVTGEHSEPYKNDQWLATATAAYTIDERTTARALVLYSPAVFEGGNRSVWLYRAELDRELTSTLSLRLIYQYTDWDTTQFNSSYQDQMVMLSLTQKL